MNTALNQLISTYFTDTNTRQLVERVIDNTINMLMPPADLSSTSDVVYQLLTDIPGNPTYERFGVQTLQYFQSVAFFAKTAHTLATTAKYEDPAVQQLLGACSVLLLNYLVGLLHHLPNKGKADMFVRQYLNTPLS